MPRKKNSDYMEAKLNCGSVYGKTVEKEAQRLKKKKDNIKITIEGKTLTADYGVMCLLLEVFGMAIRYQRLQKHIGLAAELEKIEAEIDAQLKGALR